MKRFLLILAVLVLAGCASAPDHKEESKTTGHFYGGVGAGYKFLADYWMKEENGGGRNPTANFALGHKWIFDKYNEALCQYAHWSHWRDGGPFNERPETHKDEVACWYFRNFWFWGD